MERGVPTTESRGKNPAENPSEINRLIDALSLADGEGGGLLIVTAPPSADFVRCGKRLRQLILEHAAQLAHYNLAEVQVIVVQVDGQSFKLDENAGQVSLGQIDVVYDELNASNPSGRMTIWVVPRENLGDNPNAFCELHNVIQLRGQEVILTPSTNSQSNSWPDFWSRRSLVAEIFQ